MGWYETDINGAPVVTHNGDPGDLASTMVISPSTGWGVVLLMNGSNGQARLDVPGVRRHGTARRRPNPGDAKLSQRVHHTAEPGAAADHRGSDRGGWPVDLRAPTLEQESCSRQPRTLARKIIRLGIPVLMSALWAYVCVGVLPNLLNTPFTAMRFMDYGLLLLLSFALALFWGMIIKPILGFWVLQNSSSPTRHEAAPEPEVPIPAGVR